MDCDDDARVSTAVSAAALLETLILLALAWPGLAWLGLAWLALPWLGLAWLGLLAYSRPSFDDDVDKGRVGLGSGCRCLSPPSSMFVCFFLSFVIIRLIGRVCVRRTTRLSGSYFFYDFRQSIILGRAGVGGWVGGVNSS